MVLITQELSLIVTKKVIPNPNRMYPRTPTNQAPGWDGTSENPYDKFKTSTNNVKQTLYDFSSQMDDDKYNDATNFEFVTFVVNDYIERMEPHTTEYMI